MRPGWARTPVGGVRYDGAHYSFSKCGEIEFYPEGNSLPSKIPYDLSCRGWVQEYAPFMLDQRFPPRDWFYLGYLHTGLGIYHAWRSDNHRVGVYWNKTNVMFSEPSKTPAVWGLPPSDSPAGTFRMFRDIPDHRLILTITTLSSKIMDEKIQSNPDFELRGHV